ncbi:MAG: HupE/UreJ family protein [Sulfitobacter litoralis]|uniref:HupE / UreJ protein n=2 Tax=Sulfitobacter litoralis TaxID=335975 RepID=A0ABY0SM26_9RHOB|nr:HupE/UreJ family protein [Sulfitobacter litoralis]MBQ0717912.1 HupE/UreJ family protein [Sulfitobacter litoralis]SDP41087.1 HupE / UreJ protein [Sulfitobacter litoralis]
MKTTLSKLILKLAYALVLSSGLTGFAQAHEVLPTIGDLNSADGQVTLDMRINLEALLSGIDLDEVADTNDAENASNYDSLRALPPQKIIARAPELLAQWNALPILRGDGEPVALETVALTIPEGVNEELPRIAEWSLQATLPQDTRGLVVAWPDGAGAFVLRQQGVETPYTGYLEGGVESPEILLEGGGQQSAWEAFATYIPVGFDHILPKGLDHILFVLGLFFLSTQLRPLIWQVTAFTAAHTVTLALGALGWVSVPGSIVEPLIAASIVYVAVENIFLAGLSPWRPLVIFGFGLLHGLGFASVLGEFGLPDDQFIPALIGFNVGVEVGQLTVIAVMFLCVWQALRVMRGQGDPRAAKGLYVALAVIALALCIIPMPAVARLLEAPVAVFMIPLALIFTGCFLSVQFRQVVAPYRRFVAIPASVAIAVIGAYWFVERVFL